MASSEYVSGAGGKFQKRSRRATSTPYDRPQSAIRRPNLNPNSNTNPTWFSKIVDPATKLIAKGASMFFASVFQKRLGAPPTTPEENHFGHEAPGDIANLQNPLDAALESGGNIIVNATNNPDTNGTLHTSLNAAIDCETKKEPISNSNGVFDIEQLMKQKTYTREEFDRLSSLLRSRTIEPKNSIEEGAVSMRNEKEIQQSIIEPGTLQPIKWRKKEGMLSEQRHENKSSALQGNSTNLALNFHIPDHAIASPEQIAREYMGSRTPKASHSTLGVGSQKSENLNLPVVPFLKRSYTPLLPSRNPSSISGIQEHRQNSYMTPRPRGRSAVYNNSRSPYFRASLGSNGRDSLAYVSTSSPFVSSKGTDSSNKQAVKRGRSVLENDIELYDPIRRTRQKSLISQSQREPSSSGGYVSRSEDSKTPTNFFHVPAKSTEMALKILQQLDKLEAFPKEKLSETKGSGDGDIASSSTLKLISSITPKKDKMKENSQPDAISAVESEAVISSSAASPLIEEAAAQTAKDKTPPEPDTDKNSRSITSVASAAENKKSMDTQPSSSFKTGTPSSSILKIKDDANETSNKSATKKRVDFAIPISTSRSPPERKEASSPVPNSSQERPPSVTPKTPFESFGDDKDIKKQIDASQTSGAGISTSSPISVTFGSLTSFTANSTSSTNIATLAGANASKVAPTSEISKQEPDIKTSASPSSTTSTSIPQETSNAFSNTQNSRNGIFGSTASSTQSPVFGFTSQATQPTPSAQSPVFSFTSKATQPTSSSAQSPVFGFTSEATQSAPSSTQSPVFGFTSQTAQPTASSTQSSVFGFTSKATQPATSSTQSPVFGFTSKATQPAASSTQSPVFGVTSQVAQPAASGTQSPVFGATSQATQPAASATQSPVFGVTSQATQPAASSAQSPVFGFTSQGTQPAASSAQSPVFGFTSQATQPSFGLNNNSSNTPTFNTSATSLFSSSSQPASSMFASSFASNPSLSFTSAAASPSPAQPVFGFGKQVQNYLGSDGMNVDDSKTNNNVQTTPIFGSNSQFTPPAIHAASQPVFQFGGSFNSSGTQQSSSSFQSPGNFQFSANGSFSLGSGGGDGADKSGRRIIKVRRDKHKKK